MRRRVWLNIVALLMLAVANLPASVIASMCHPVKCEMACCQGQDSAPQEVAEASHCGDEVVQAQAGGSCGMAEPASPSISTLSGDPCKCQISPGSSSEPKPVVLAPTANPTPTIVYAILPVAEPVLVAIEAFQVRAGIYAADSGPPVSRPHCAWLGRAPPVLLA